MRKIILLAMFASFFTARAATPTAAKLRDMLQQCVTNQHRSPGMVVGVVDKNGVTIIAGGDAKEDSLFEIGSITKLFTALLLQDMVDHGEVGLDDPVAKYLPSTVEVPSRNGKQITLRQLATHTSGLPRLPDNLKPADEDDPYADYTVENLYAFLNSYKLKHNPGSHEEYSNLGMGLLGHALALRAGTNYEALITQRIIRPLGLSNTCITLSRAQQARFAKGHSEDGTECAYWNLPTLAGCGALRSTAPDLLRFVSAQMGLIPTPLSGAMVRTQASQTGLLERTGLAWQIDVLGGFLWHNGGTGGFRSYLGFMKNKEYGVVVLSDSENDVDDVGLYLLGDRDSLDKYKAPKPHIEIKVDPAILDKYAGTYRFGWGGKFFVKREGDKLMAQLTGQGSYQVFPESKTDYFYKVVDAQLTFVTTSDGATQAVILHQNGTNQRAKKVE